MESFFVALLQFVLEALLNILFYAPFELMSYKGEKAEGNHTWLKCLIYVGLGVLIGWLSSGIFSRPVSHSRLVLAIGFLCGAFLTAYISYTVAKYLSNKGKQVSPERHFGYALCFMLGLAAIRFFMSAGSRFS